MYILALIPVKRAGRRTGGCVLHDITEVERAETPTLLDLG